MDQILNDFSVGLFFISAILVLVLVVLMGKFAWRPILDSLQTREDGIKNALDSAEKARLEMQNLQADNKKLLNEARAEREAMLKEAREMKDKMIEAAKTEAETQANTIIEQAHAAIESEKKAAIAELKSHVAGLSIEIAEKVLREELSDNSKQQKLVDSLIGEATLN